MKEPIITIPTYWTRKGGLKKLGDTYFDHPTHLDGQETLTRTLDSLKEVEDKFKVVVVTSTVAYSDDKLYNAVEKKVESLIKKYRKHFPIMQFVKSDIKFLKERLKKFRLTGLIPQINLAWYPSIRNCQLIVTNGLGADVMIGLDDDEIVKPNHVSKATTFIGKKYKDKPIYAIGGYYKDKKGDHIMWDLPKPKIDNIFYRKRWVKNNGFIAIDKMKGRVQKANFIFGGNMVIHRKLFMNVAYDLGITRGENMDYLINAKMHGFDCYFDKEFYIVHMPPEKWDKKIKKFQKTGAFSKTSYSKLVQDILRFVYEKEKIRECNDHHPELHDIDIDELKPYPGEFFSDFLIHDSIQALKHMYPDAAKKQKKDPKEDVGAVLERARKLAPNYFLFNERWKKMMKKIERDRVFRKHLESKWL